MEYQKSAGLIVYHKDKEIKFLLLKYSSYWGFVKGIIEDNEEEEKTALRELEEEAGIKAELIKGFKEKQEWFFRLKGKLVKKQAIFFLAKTLKEQAKKVKISFEHEDFAWLTYEKALEKMEIRSNKELLKKAYEFVKDYEKQKRLVFSEKIRKKEERGDGVFSHKDDTEGFPHECPKCGYSEADVIDLGAPYSDESNIYLFKCKKCGHVKRQADGSGNK